MYGTVDGTNCPYNRPTVIISVIENCYSLVMGQFLIPSKLDPIKFI